MTTKTTKLSVFAFLGLGLVAYGQYNGKVGINTSYPNATLEIQISDANKSGSTKEGILIPNVTAARAKAMGEGVAESTLVYITDGTGEANTTISNVSGKGFYYYDATDKKWQKVVGNSNGVTLNTITGNIREVTSITPEEWAKPNTFALVQTSGDQIKLPDPSSYTNKIISVNNQYNNSVSYFNTNKPKNSSSLDSGKGHLLMSDGTTWYIIGGSY
ncbi:hypothetical protein [Riemerella anatipestifer]|uniref:hypothetical protein n=1 Tax=Riemerella anatipestifer TaxID=34085 RepID=UPI00129DA990|nr:hypothetical protein [Riemerella anatipestifer]MBT0551190.1 hypothetical protein [Riemerella anatipestifer]MBT0552955.1 hypothetical protein [Riemerella anatipestifer]MCE3025276.1 hypothetical protein [Riemerella anatipestifer]MCU7542546.1 hypothetical protein [Riemerella anatipestifer]MCU7558723.1 hypothetical protein [Riemerella anatipestifer]